MPLQCYSWQCHSNLYMFNNNNNHIILYITRKTLVWRCNYRGYIASKNISSWFPEVLDSKTGGSLRCVVLGFLCPVHTPDGGPCGLLNHATAHCEVQSLKALCDVIQVCEYRCADCYETLSSTKPMFSFCTQIIELWTVFEQIQSGTEKKWTTVQPVNIIYINCC